MKRAVLKAVMEPPLAEVLLERQSPGGLTDLHTLLKDLPPSSPLPPVSEIHQLSDTSLIRKAFQYASPNATSQQSQPKKIQPKEILNYQEGVQDHMSHSCHYSTQRPKTDKDAVSP